MATEEASDWSWTAPDGEDVDEDALEKDDVKQVAMWTIKTCVDEGMTPNQASTYVPFSNTTVYNWLEDYNEGDREKRDWVESVEQVIV